MMSVRVNEGLLANCCWSCPIQLWNMSPAPELLPIKFATVLKEPLTPRNTVAQLDTIMATTRYLTAAPPTPRKAPPPNAASYDPVRKNNTRISTSQFLPFSDMATPPHP